MYSDHHLKSLKMRELHIIQQPLPFLVLCYPNVACVISILDQEERELSVKAFRERRKDVLVATDVASKGLDFQGIRHVINYDMPDDIENYGMT